MIMCTLRSTPTTPAPLASSVVHRITVDEYERIIAAGAKLRKVYVSGQQVPLTIGGRRLSPIAVDDLLPRAR